MQTDSISYNYPEIDSKIDRQTDNHRHSHSIIKFEFILILIIIIIKIILISYISVFNMINSSGLLTLFFLNHDYLLDVILLRDMNLTTTMQIFSYLYRSS